MNGIIKTNIDLVNAAVEVAKNYKTLYVNGCFGAPMNNGNKQYFCNNTSYNKRPERTQMIMNASSDTFGFDCVCFIKGLLWGWKGDINHPQGGAKYQSNGVPDITESGMLNACTDISNDFNNIEVGEYLWMQGHCGVYIGNGLAVECTPAWRNNVQITACNRNVAGYNRRNWTKHGKLPYISYTPVELKPYTQEDFIKDIQSILGVSVTGKCDDETLNKTITVSEFVNNKHAIVIPLQKYLYSLGYTSVGSADGEAGPKFTQAVKDYQKSFGGEADGEVTAKETTWKKLLNYVPTHVCNFVPKITKQASCTEKGIQTYSCSCGKSYTEEIPMINHNYNQKIIAPTCENDGYTNNTCVRCGHSFNNNIIQATGHNYITTTIEPTYETEGYDLHTCQICNNNYKDNIINPLQKEEPEITPEPQPIIPESQPEPQPIVPEPILKDGWEINDEAKIIAGARFVTGKEILSWIVKNKVYIRDLREHDSAVISTQKVGPITGAVYLKDLLPYSDKLYDISITANLLNVRENPNSNSKIINQIKKDTKHTIIEEQGEWGHIANSGWIMLQYTRKV